MRLFAFLTLLLLAAPDLQAQDAQPNITQAELTEVLQSAREEMDLPGLRAAVRLPDGTMVEAAVGLANKESGESLDTDIGMPGGSTGKTFVAALALVLVEDGTLSLRDPVSKWLGDHEWFRDLPNSDEMRVHHLLSHSAGLKDYVATFCFQRKMIGRAIRDGSAYFEPEELIDCVATRRAEFPAGRGYVYTDAGYLVLGRLLEAASGKSYFDLLEERVLNPLGLDDIQPMTESVMTGITMGYTRGGTAFKKDGRQKYDPRSEWTGGGLITTPAMLAEFYAALADGRLISSESFQRMQEMGWKDSPSAEWHYGLGVFVDGRGRWISHGGLWPGFRSHVALGLQSGTAVAVQTNRDGRVDLEGLVSRIFLRTAPD